MARPPILVRVRLVAMNLACGRCLTRQRIPLLAADPMSHPVVDWIRAHHEPRIESVETERHIERRTSS